MFKNFGAAEIIIVLVVLLLLFGGNRLPELTRGLINSIKEFRSAYKEGSDSPKNNK